MAVAICLSIAFHILFVLFVSFYPFVFIESAALRSTALPYACAPTATRS